MNVSEAKQLGGPRLTLPAALWRLGVVVVVIGLGALLGTALTSPETTETALAAVAMLILVTVIVHDPLTGLLVWIVTQPISEVYFNLSLGASIPDISPTRLVVGLLTVLVLGRVAVGRMKLAPWSLVDVAALCLMLGMAASAPNGRGGWLSLQAIFDHYFVPVLIYFVAKNLVRTQEETRKVLAAIVFTSAIVGLYAIYEQTTGHILIPVESTGSTDYGNGIHILRGLLGHPHDFGRVIGLALPVNFYMVLEEKRPHYRLLAILALGISLAGLFLTYRRTAWIAAVASLFVIQFFYPRFRRLFVVIAIVVGGLYFLYQNDLGDSAAGSRANSGNIATLNGRTEGWDYATELWERKPITGHGYGQFTAIAKREGQRDVAIESQYLSILVSAGLLGFVPYILVLIGLPLSQVGAFRRTTDPVKKWLFVVFWGALASYLVNAYTATINQPISTHLLFLMAGAIYLLQAPRSAEPA